MPGVGSLKVAMCISKGVGFKYCSSPTSDTLPAISMVLFPRYFLKFLYLPVCLTCKFPEMVQLNDGVPGTESVQPAEKRR